MGRTREMAKGEMMGRPRKSSTHVSSVRLHAWTDVDPQLLAKCQRIAEQRCRGITRLWADRDMPLSILTKSCYLQGLEDCAVSRAEVESRMRSKSFNKAYDGERCTD